MTSTTLRLLALAALLGVACCSLMPTTKQPPIELDDVKQVLLHPIRGNKIRRVRQTMLDAANNYGFVDKEGGQQPGSGSNSRQNSGRPATTTRRPGLNPLGNFAAALGRPGTTTRRPGRNPVGNFAAALGRPQMPSLGRLTNPFGGGQRDDDGGFAFPQFRTAQPDRGHYDDHRGQHDDHHGHHDSHSHEHYDGHDHGHHGGGYDHGHGKH